MAAGSPKGDDTLIDCIYDFVGEVVCDVLGKRMSPLLEEAAVAKRASSQNTRPTDERASIRVDVLR